MSFDVCDMTQSNATLSRAILLYSGEGISYATIHPVSCKDGEAPQIRAGRPMSLQAVREICADLANSALLRSGVLPDTILSIGLEHVVWWQRPGIRHQFFDCATGDSVSVGVRNGKAPTPGIVFAVCGKEMYAFAVKGDQRPLSDTPLFHMPYMNVWASGKVCTGSMPKPNDCVADSVLAWESAYWNSAFSHPNHPHPVRYKGGIHQLMIDLLDGKYRKFPSKALNPVKGMTLGSFVGSLDKLNSKKGR